MRKWLGLKKWFLPPYCAAPRLHAKRVAWGGKAFYGDEIRIGLFRSAIFLLFSEYGHARFEPSSASGWASQPFIGECTFVRSSQIRRRGNMQDLS